MSLQTKSSEQKTELLFSLPQNDNTMNESRIANAEIPPPSSYPDPKVVDGVLAQEMNKLSLQERERVYEDIHGVSENIQEEPLFVQDCLFKMQQALDKISHKPAYDLAMTKSPSYVTGIPLRLAFLRSTDFDPKHAAHKFMAYFENKKLYFGEDAIGRPIKLSDLDKHDLESLKKGWLQVLQFRDKAGRAVVWAPFDYHFYKTVPNAVRCCWYRIMTLLEDEENQKRGIVHVITGVDEVHLTDEVRGFTWVGTQFMMFMPIKFVSFHMCLRSKIASPVASFIQLAAAKTLRVRIRVHCGTDTECKYALMTFGIPVNYAPITSSGELKARDHRQWILRRQRLESFRDHCISVGQSTMKNNNEVSFYGDNTEIELPARSDILVGKGIPAQQHHGNLLYMSIVDRYKEQYSNAIDSQKSIIIDHILNEIQQVDNRTRFLERNNDGWWIESSKNVVTKKIHHRLRLKVQPDLSSRPFRNAPEPGTLSFLNHAGSSSDGKIQRGCFGCMGDRAKRSKVSDR